MHASIPPAHIINKLTHEHRKRWMNQKSICASVSQNLSYMMITCVIGSLDTLHVLMDVLSIVKLHYVSRFSTYIIYIFIHVLSSYKLDSFIGYTVG